MEKIIAIYNLKKGVSIEDYKKWSREVDQQITPNQNGVRSFEVYEILGADEGSAKYQVVELLDVDSWEKWKQTLKGKGMEKVVTEWYQYGDGDGMITLYGKKI